jgi:hypothetical protein
MAVRYMTKGLGRKELCAMRESLDEEQYKALLQPDIIRLITGINEFKGRQDLNVQANPDTLETMRELARNPRNG